MTKFIRPLLLVLASLSWKIPPASSHLWSIFSGLRDLLCGQEAIWLLVCSASFLSTSGCSLASVLSLSALTRTLSRFQHSAGFQRYLQAPAAVSLPHQAAGFSPGAVSLSFSFLAAAQHFGPLRRMCQILVAGCHAKVVPTVGKDARGHYATFGPLSGVPETRRGRRHRVLNALPRWRQSQVCLHNVQNRSAAGWSEGGWVMWWAGWQETSH